MSYNCSSYNCDDALGDHVLNDCGVGSQGGYPNCILLECVNEITDPSDATEVQAAIDAGEAHLIKDVKLAIPAASPVKLDSMIANNPQIVSKYEFAGTMIDGNVNTSNITFYNNLYDGRKFGGIILHNKDEGVVYWFNAAIIFEGSLILPDGDGEFERFESTFSFKTKPENVVPGKYTEPAGIFD